MPLEVAEHGDLAILHKGELGVAYDTAHGGPHLWGVHTIPVGHRGKDVQEGGLGVGHISSWSHTKDAIVGEPQAIVVKGMTVGPLYRTMGSISEMDDALFIQPYLGYLLEKGLEGQTPIAKATG